MGLFETEDKLAEGCAVNWAVCSGACDKCRYLDECESNRGFKFPEDAPCAVKKAEVLEKWRKGRAEHGKT